MGNDSHIPDTESSDTTNRSTMIIMSDKDTPLTYQRAAVMAGSESARRASKKNNNNINKKNNKKNKRFDRTVCAMCERLQHTLRHDSA